MIPGRGYFLFWLALWVLGVIPLQKIAVYTLLGIFAQGCGHLLVHAAPKVVPAALKYDGRFPGAHGFVIADTYDAAGVCCAWALQQSPHIGPVYIVFGPDTAHD